MNTGPPIPPNSSLWRRSPFSSVRVTCEKSIPSCTRNSKDIFCKIPRSGPGPQSPSDLNPFPGQFVLLALLASAVTVSPALLAVDERFPNEATNSSLAQGPCVAAYFKADVGIAAHPAVIFAHNFENGELGTNWDDTNNPKALSLSPSGAEICGRRCLKVEARLGENQGGGLTKWFEPAAQVFVRFYVRFDPGCDYVHHFVTLRANRGLRGGDKWSGFGGAGFGRR